MALAYSESQSHPQLWNKLPPEILGVILSKLEKHDLLNSRLVSHAWNEESLKTLKKSEFTQLLTEEKLKEFIQFTMPTDETEPQPRPFIIPFHLNFTFNLVSFGILSLRTLTPLVDTLFKVFGTKCVSAITLSTDDTVYTEETDTLGLIEFLTLCSPGLKTLDLTKFIFGFDFLNNNQNKIIKFLNLKKLICNTSECKRGKIGPRPAYVSIIENSPHLEDLSLTHSCDLEHWSLNFAQLKSLALGRMIKPQNILDKIQHSSGPPVLRELRFRVEDIYERPNGDSDDGEDEEEVEENYGKNDTVIRNILNSLSPTLKSLKIWGRCGDPRIIFPVLPHVEHLGLEYHVDTTSNLDPEYFNLNEETFPSLKSIELPLGFAFLPFHEFFGKEEDEENKVRVPVVFPNVDKLTLRVNCNETYGHAHFYETLEDLQNMFPAPSKLSFINTGAYDSVKYVLDRIVKSNWSKNIREIEMIGFSGDHLEGFLNQLEFSPRVVIEKCDRILERLLRRKFRSMMEKRKMEFEEEEISGDPGSVILTRANQSDSFKMTNITTIKHNGCNYDHDTHRILPWSASLSPRVQIPISTDFLKHFPELRVLEFCKSMLE